MRLQVAYPTSEKENAKKVEAALSSLGYEVIEVKEKPLYPEEVILAIFSSKTEEKDFLRDLPWLEKQKEYSSIHYLHVMPFFVYSSKEEDPEKAFEGKAGELYEDVFSGEFKPFGWDFASKDPAQEFARVLEDYQE